MYTVIEEILRALSAAFSRDHDREPRHSRVPRHRTPHHPRSTYTPLRDRAMPRVRAV